MNAVEIEQAVSELAASPFDAAEFPFAFLEAFGNKATTIKKLRSGASNRSDLAGTIGAVLQTNNIHIAVSPEGEVSQTLAALKASPATAKAKAKFVLATDGQILEAEALTSDDAPLVCEYQDFPDHFGFFLALAGIATVEKIRENSFDIRATSRLNRLYVELLRNNPEWDTSDRRPDMNHFMARLIFSFFAEDTDIFNGTGLFTATVDQMSARDSSNTDEVISEIFRAMNTPTKHHGEPDDRYRKAANIPRWADQFPYVNGGLFSGSSDVPRFSKIARSYLIHIGNLDWTKVNPDIFGSMIQAIAEDEERGALGMHYTSVPNILKVLNPLFLDELRGKLEEAGNNTRKLLNLRNRIAKIRIFDPACGSGNFLVIAYKEMRAIEAEVNRRRDEAERRTDIPLTNFRGIELRDFPAEIARLALIIAEYQCDVTYRGQKEALAEFLPLDAMNWITSENALRIDWKSICPPIGASVTFHAEDLFSTALDQAQIDFENEGGETYLCGNPPYKGARKQRPSEKSDLKAIYHGHDHYKDADYVTGWFIKAASYSRETRAKFAFVSTSSVCQGEQVQFVWPRIWERGLEIFFAHTPFQWKNNATNNAGVFVAIVGVRPRDSKPKKIFEGDQQRIAFNISPYLTNGPDVVVETADKPLSKDISKMIMGNMARDDGNLILSPEEGRELGKQFPEAKKFIKPLLGTKEIVGGTFRLALHLGDDNIEEWNKIEPIARRVKKTKIFRQLSRAKTTTGYASVPHRFAQYCHKEEDALALPSVTPEDRSHVTPVLIKKGVMVTNLAYLIYGFSLAEFALICSAMHVVWVRSVSGRHGSGVRYTPTISYHTFPVPNLTDKNRHDLTRCAENILLAREAHFPETLADLYRVDQGEVKMPADLRAAHQRNDEVIERIYIGRRFRNDTERLERLFELYAKMITKNGPKQARTKVKV